LLASWIDFFFIFIVLKLVFYLFLILSINTYFPFEFTVLISVITYSIVTVGLYGKTLGKWLLNLEVVKRNDHKLSFIGAIFRESILKIFSTLVFFFGFIWIGFSRSRRGWHDNLAGTKVIVAKTDTQLNRVFKVISVISFLFVLGSFLSEIFYGWNFGRNVQLTEQITHPYHQRSVSDLCEITDITATDDTLFTNWLGLNGKSPAEYAIKVASDHRITIFGEYHHINSNLDF